MPSTTASFGSGGLVGSENAIVVPFWAQKSPEMVFTGQYRRVGFGYAAMLQGPGQATWAPLGERKLSVSKIWTAASGVAASGVAASVAVASVAVASRVDLKVQLGYSPV